VATATLSCSDPIGTLPSPTSPQQGILDVVALQTTSTLQVSDSSDDAYRLFAKTGLMIHTGRASTLTLPVDRAGRAAIAWGNPASEWATSLEIPACPSPTSGQDVWLVFPGGFSLDVPACVPLQVRAGSEVSTVRVAVGAPCPN
jgi:hypothetical protein